MRGNTLLKKAVKVSLLLVFAWPAFASSGHGDAPRRFPLAGEYTPGAVDLHLRLAKFPSQKHIPDEYEAAYDAEGGVYFVSQNVEISGRDIDHLTVKESDSRGSWQIEFFLGNDFLHRCQEKGKTFAGQCLALFKEKKLVLVSYFQQFGEKALVLNVDDSEKLKTILEGMIRIDK